MTESYKFKRMKQLFLVFLKQFEVDDYKLLIRFLHLIINNYNTNPTKLFGFLTNLNDYSIEKELNDQNSIKVKNFRFKFKTPISYYQKQKRNFLIRENRLKSRESNILTKNTQFTTDDFQFYDNENYSDVNYLKDNEQNKTYNFEANRNEIIEAFVAKENDELNSVATYEEDFEDESWQNPNNNNNKTRIRKFSDNIRNELERHFLANNFISGAEKTVLAMRLNLKERQVQKWFVHRREKLRRLEKKTTLIDTPFHCQKQQKLNRLSDNFSNNKTKQIVTENPYQKVYVTKGGYTINNNQNKELYSFNDNDSEIECLYEKEKNEDCHLYDDWIDNQNKINDNNLDKNINFSIINDDDNEFDQDEDIEELNEYSSEINNNSINENPDFNYNLKTTNKGSRRLFAPEVITHLEKIFDTEKYLKENQVFEIAKITKLNEKQIRSWFKQRRYRYNHENKINGVDIDFGFKKRDNLPQFVVDQLEQAFLKNNYIFGEEKKNLSRKLNLKPIQLERWFYYRRKKNLK
jgi:hypothetical protein